MCLRPTVPITDVKKGYYFKLHYIYFSNISNIIIIHRENIFKYIKFSTFFLNYMRIPIVIIPMLFSDTKSIFDIKLETTGDYSHNKPKYQATVWQTVTPDFARDQQVCSTCAIANSGAGINPFPYCKLIYFSSYNSSQPLYLILWQLLHPLYLISGIWKHMAIVVIPQIVVIEFRFQFQKLPGLFSITGPTYLI
jgi:hypothetical protein